MVFFCLILVNKESKKILDSVEYWKCFVDFILQGGDSGCFYFEVFICRRFIGKFLQVMLYILCICVFILVYKDFSVIVSKI